MRIHYPIDEKQIYYVDGFRVLHLAYLNKYHLKSKRRFYQFMDWEWYSMFMNFHNNMDDNSVDYAV